MGTLIIYYIMKIFKKSNKKYDNATPLTNKSDILPSNVDPTKQQSEESKYPITQIINPEVAARLSVTKNIIDSVSQSDTEYEDEIFH